MKQNTLSRLSGQYLAALQSYIGQGSQAGMAAAHGLGSQAVALELELGMLELTKIHDEALAALMPAGGAPDGNEAMSARAAEFFAEAHRPVEQSHRPALADDGLRAGETQAVMLLAEACQLQEHLQALARQIITAQEEERRTMSLTLQDEIAQTLLGIHVRLLALQREASAGAEDFQNEIAATRRLVLESATTINHYAGELDQANET